MKRKNVRKRAGLLVAGTFAFLATVSPAFASTLVWNVVTDNWFTPGSWMPAGPPTISDSAQINNGGTAQIAAPGAIADFVTLGLNSGNSGTLSISGTGTLTTNNQSVIVGADGTGIMNITGGGSLTNNFGVGSVIAVGSTATGTVTVSGTGSQWTNTGNLTVGGGGNGTLHISSGGTVSNTSITTGDIAASGHSIGLVTVDGMNSLWSLSSSLTVGDRGTGTMTITNGGKVSNISMGIIGAFVTTIGPGSPASAVGTVNVDGANSLWTNTGDDIVGLFGSGTMNITKGGTVSSADGYVAGAPFAGGSPGLGAVTVDGMGSNWTMPGDLNVGFRGTGTLMITNKGAVSNVNGVLGHDADTSGIVTVDGAGSKWTNSGNLQVGLDGTGALNVMTGGAVKVNGSFARIGEQSDGVGTVKVDGGGSTLTLANELDVGRAGTGTLTIQNGGIVTMTGSARAAIGLTSGSMGTVTVDGSGSTFDNHNDNIYVGGDSSGAGGTGLLRITNSGTVSATSTTVWSTGTLEIGVNPVLNGTLFFTGGTLRTIANTTFPNTIVLGGSGIIVDSDGFTSTLSGPINGVVGGMTKVNPGTIILTNSDTIPDGTNIYGGVLQVDGSLNGNVVVKADGTLAGIGTVAGNVDNNGIVSPGDSPGTLTIMGTYMQHSGATLRIEIAGLAAAQHDLLAVGGGATLGGTLQVLRLNNFQPMKGDRVTILNDGGGHSGTFSSVTSTFPGVLQPVPQYDELNDVYVLFQLGSFNIGGLTQNQKSVAAELNEVANDPAAAALINFLDLEPLGSLPRDYDLIAPEELASIYEISISQAIVTNNNLQHRMDDIRAGSNGYCQNFTTTTSGKESSGKDVVSDGGKMVAPSSSTDIMLPAPENPWGVFVTGSGDFVNVGNDDDNAHGYDITTGNVLVGVDYRVTDHFAVGVDGSYTGGRADLVDHGRVEVDGGKAGVYATLFGKGFFGSKTYIDGAVSGGWNSYDTRRTGLQDLPVRGSTNGGEFNALIAYGSEWTFGCFNIGTWSTIQYTRVQIDEFTETGSLAPLIIQDQKEDSIRGTAGLRASYDIRMGRAIIRPEVRAGWQTEYGDPAYQIDARFASGAGDVFRVRGPSIGRDSALVDGGLAVQWSRCCSAYVYYDGVLGRDNYDSHAISGGLRISF